ncbi:uncharacterized protein LOC108626407 [Ceratina calcarata]|uniref:Uncharacterized protein LOC108626407 n=1 Tax=Ceratina calcarata TaxID=156304 RepID=A0AAJ7WC02_9HYME|nr:uncharacterized protein LOC108626407 [Ceratina calcarata]
MLPIGSTQPIPGEAPRLQSVGPVTVASYRRRHQLAEEVPGLYIRRLTLEDPRSAREPSSSRSQSPARHICHPTTGYVPSSRRSSSYRSWLERIRKERPPFLTIVSLELPESPIPLIESQASARSRAVDTKDDVSDELLEKVTSTESGSETEPAARGRKRSSRSRKSRAAGRKGGEEFLECTKGAPTLEECTKNIVEGAGRLRLSNFNLENANDCICSEVSGNVRADIEGDTESRSSSPEITRTIRIAMRQHDLAGCKLCDDDDETEGNGRSRPETNGRNVTRKESVKDEDGCNGVSGALDFTLNCSSVRLTCRDANLRIGTGSGEKQRRGLETQN